MAKKGLYEDLNVYQAGLTVGEYTKIYNTLAMRTNKRIYRLRQAGAKVGNFAAVGYLEKIGRRKFKETNIFTEMSDFKRIQKEITIMQGFLQSERTTKSGRKRILKKTQATFKSQGLDLNEQSLDRFLTQFEDAKAASSFDSDTIKNILSSVTNEKTKPEKVDEIIREIVTSNSIREAASRVAALEGVTKTAGQILADLLE